MEERQLCGTQFRFNLLTDSKPHGSSHPGKSAAGGNHHLEIPPLPFMGGPPVFDYYLLNRHGARAH
jgi:hypothetical protein